MGMPFLHFVVIFSVICNNLNYLFFSSSVSPSHCRFQLRGPLIIWNTMLAMFSIMGAFRTAPELLHVLRHYGLFHSVCVPR